MYLSRVAVRLATIKMRSIKSDILSGVSLDGPACTKITLPSAEPYFPEFTPVTPPASACFFDGFFPQKLGPLGRVFGSC